MFLYKRQSLNRPEESKRKAYLQKRRKTQHLEKAYPPPYKIFKRKTHTIFHKPTLTCDIQPILELLFTHISPLNPSGTPPINNLQTMFFSNWRTKNNIYFSRPTHSHHLANIFFRVCAFKHLRKPSGKNHSKNYSLPSNKQKPRERTHARGASLYVLPMF